MLCLYNTPVVHNSEIRFDFVTLSCFGYYHLKYIHGPTPFKMAVVHGKEMAVGTASGKISRFESQMDHLFIHPYTSQQICYKSTVVC